MDRRRFCTAVLGGTFGSLAGCSAAGTMDADGGGASDRATPTAERTADPGETVSLAETGYPADICESEVIEDFGIEAIIDPTFGTSWRDHDIDPSYLRDDGDEGLDDDASVIGRVVDGHARAYPLSVLWHHEIVNDTHGLALIVTYCSICRSGLVADRRVQGEPTLFGVSGQLWRPPDRAITASEQSGRAFGANRWNASDQPSVRDGGNLVMYDELTESFWSQAMGRAICGPATGTQLPIVPSALTAWRDWRTEHPDTEVLLPPPHSDVG